MSELTQSQILNGIMGLATQISISEQKIKLIKELQAVLEKNVEDRTHGDQTIINKFLISEPFFQEISELSSPDVSKNILKSAKVRRIPSKRVVSEMGKPINAIYLILSGTFGVSCKRNQTNLDDKKPAEKLNLLIQKAERMIKRYKSSYIKFGREQTSLKKPFERPRVDLSEIQLLETVNQSTAYGIDELLISEDYNTSTFTVSDSVVLEIKVYQLMEAFLAYKNKLIAAKIDIFCRASPVFGKIPVQRLKDLIQNSPTETRYRGQCIYSEGDKAEFLYVLKQGQLLLKKNIQLFKEDPNNFYKKRSSLRFESGQRCSDLPFADLEKVYNYQPATKKVELGILSEITIFGEEQVFEKEKRQVTAQVVSSNVEIYCISLKILEAILKDKRPSIEQFKIMLFENITNKRIMYRQEKLSELISINNKSNMNYFFLPQDFSKSNIKQQKKELQSSPAKSTKQDNRQLIKPRDGVRRFNKRISMMNIENLGLLDEEQGKSKELSHSIKQAEQKESVKSKPTYHSFNFTKIGFASMRKSEETKCDLSKDQKSIADLTHTVSLISKRVKQVVDLGEKLGVRRYSIDIRQPLFELDFIKKMKKQKLRIDNNQRRQRFDSVSQVSSRPKTASTRPHSAITVKTTR